MHSFNETQFDKFFSTINKRINLQLVLCFTYYQDDFILPSKYNILKGLGENIFLISILNAELPNLIYFWTTSIS